MVSYNHFNYPRYWRHREYEQKAEEIALKRILKKIPLKNSLVNIGAGYGRLAHLYAPVFKNCLLLEPSPSLLRKAKKKLSAYPNISFKRGTAQKLPLPARSFDLALMIRVSHHLPDLEKPFNEVHRVLKPGGYFLFEFANKINFKSTLKAVFKRRLSFFLSHMPINLSDPKKADFLNYHPNQILTLLAAAGFQVVETVSVSNFRLKIFKRLIPLWVLLFFEKLFSRLTTCFLPLKYFGPSIFVLTQKDSKVSSRPA